MKFYTLDMQLIKEENSSVLRNFTGIAVHPIDVGIKEWYFEGKTHRLDGPAIEWSNGLKEWYIHDKKCTQEQHALFISIMKLKGLTK